MILAVLNQKGGVGKTSTCHHLAGTLARMGRRVLLADLDPQSSLSQGLLGPTATRELDPAATADAVLAGDLPEPAAVLRPVDEGVRLLPGSPRAARHNVPEPHLAHWEAQPSLREFLAEAAAQEPWDLALIDCPPNLHLCSWAALVAADAVLVPLQSEDYGAQGIADVAASIARVQAGPNPALRLLGYLITMRSARRTVHQIFEAQLRQTHGALVLDTAVPQAPEFPEAIMHRRPIAAYKPKGAAARAIRAVADELLARSAAAAADGGADAADEGQGRGAA